MKIAGKPADEIREMWQSRALREADGRLQRVLLAVFTAEYPDKLLLLLKATFGTVDIPTPFYRGYARVVSSGQLFCEVVDRDAHGIPWRGNIKIYDNAFMLTSQMRRLADKMKLVDEDRIELFMLLRKWMTRDERIDIYSEKTAAA